MASPEIIRLRELIAGRFPNARVRLTTEESDAAPAPPPNIWRTGCAALDDALGGGLPRSVLCEVVCPPNTTGSATLLHTLLRQAASENQIIAIVDGSDSLDVTSLEEYVLSRLLWVRTRTVETTLKAVDILMRDSNPSLLIVDLVLNPQIQFQKIRANTWYRFQRLAEERNTVCVFFTPFPLVAARGARVTLKSISGTSIFNQTAEEVLSCLKAEVSEARPISFSTQSRVA